jgi:hypothetical protein
VRLTRTQADEADTHRGRRACTRRDEKATGIIFLNLNLRIGERERERKRERLNPKMLVFVYG